MTTRELLDSIGPGITGALKAVDPVQIEEAVDAIYAADRVFTAGWGRAGNVVSSFSDFTCACRRLRRL